MCVCVHARELQYPSITIAVNKKIFLLQAAQSKKGKAAEKSPAEETAKTIVTAASDADVKLVRELIEARGQKVRERKATGATKVT